jgi:elongator complex protein 5
MIDCHGKSMNHVQSTLAQSLSQTNKNVVLIDTLTYIPGEALSQFLVSIMQRNTTIMATFHTTLPTAEKPPAANQYYPNPLALLQYFATSCITVSPTRVPDLVQEDRDKELEKFLFPLGCNKPTFEVKLVHRRRSGRSITAEYVVSHDAHTIEYIVPKKDEEDDPEDPALLENLTTFNLTTTEKQRQAKENVDLPFLQAQEFGDGGARGGAIIYQFEKDDDYDEEDPYEDPF